MPKLLCLVLIMFGSVAQAQTAPDAAELTTLLNNFLVGAGRNDVGIHENFWASDLIYTGAAGRRVSKADIMSDLRKATAPVSGPKTVYSAEEIRIQQYGDTAIVAFRLVATVERGKKSEVSKFFNTGTFLKRNGKWQAVAWQATRLPRPENAARSEVTEVEVHFHKAFLDADVAAVDDLLDESFIWTHTNGEQVTKPILISQLKSGQLKLAKFEPGSVMVTISGDTGVARGSAEVQRSAVPGQSAAGDPAPFKFSYTLTFVNKGGPWKAVAMHSSRR